MENSRISIHENAWYVSDFSRGLDKSLPHFCLGFLTLPTLRKEVNYCLPHKGSIWFGKIPGRWKCHQCSFRTIKRSKNHQPGTHSSKEPGWVFFLKTDFSVSLRAPTFLTFIIGWVESWHTHRQDRTSAAPSDMHVAWLHAHRTCAQSTASVLWGYRTAEPHRDTHISSIITSFGTVSTAGNYRHITQGYTFASHRHLP